MCASRGSAGCGPEGCLTNQPGLTALQRRIRRIVGELPAGTNLALAGGGALIVSGVVDRPTTDLDFFAPYPQRIDEVVDLVQAALEADGLLVTRLDDKPSFARLRIQSGDDTTTVDLATDARLMATAHTDAGDVLALAELAADKVLALEGRAEARDFVDFAALTERFTVAELCDLAARKDDGFNPERLARVLAAFDYRNPAAYNDYPVEYRRLQAAIRSALSQMEHLRPAGPAPDTSEPGVDL